VTSGGKWNSALLEATYNGNRPFPDLYHRRARLGHQLRSEYPLPQRSHVAALFINHPDADVDAAVNQLSLAGLLAR
jgi:hypothetical protein